MPAAAAVHATAASSAAAAAAAAAATEARPAARRRTAGPRPHCARCGGGSSRKGPGCCCGQLRQLYLQPVPGVAGLRVRLARRPRVHMPQRASHGCGHACRLQLATAARLTLPTCCLVHPSLVGGQACRLVAAACLTLTRLPPAPSTCPSPVPGRPGLRVRGVPQRCQERGGDCGHEPARHPGVPWAWCAALPAVAGGAGVWLLLLVGLAYGCCCCWCWWWGWRTAAAAPVVLLLGALTPLLPARLALPLLPAAYTAQRAGPRTAASAWRSPE